jgi:hypothetical protein
MGLIRFCIGLVALVPFQPLGIVYAAYLALARDMHSALSWYVKTSRWLLTGRSNY